MKIWDVEGMMQAMPYRVFREWMAYFQIEKEELDAMRQRTKGPR